MNNVTIDEIRNILAQRLLHQKRNKKVLTYLYQFNANDFKKINKEKIFFEQFINKNHTKELTKELELGFDNPISF